MFSLEILALKCYNHTANIFSDKEGHFLATKAKSDSMSPEFFGTESVWKIMLRIAPPIMLAQLIQAMYNIIDSLFVGQFSDDGLTALSAIYPIQLIIIALAVGTGVGTNTLMAKQYALKDEKGANHTAGVGMVLAVIMWALTSVLSVAFMGLYVGVSVQSPIAMQYANEYGLIVSIGSIGLFLEGNWTKVHQAAGNMKLPMIAQIVGAVINIILDPLFIFTAGLGIKGAAIATVIGQIAAAVIVGVKGARKPPSIKQMPKIAKNIYKLGYPSICMQSLYTVYIAILNIILAGFCDEAVTVLGLYYKLQSFFFIPLLGLQTCIVPVLSYNFTSGDYIRCRKIFRSSLIISGVFMILGVLSFELIPTQLIGLFTRSETVKSIGAVGFRLIGASFIPAVFSFMTPVFFQSIGYSKTSTFLSVLRQIVCLVPLFWLFSLIGLDYTWLAFPLSEIITGAIGMGMYYYAVKRF